MTKEELFSIWAPSDSLWSPWVKPVLFACMEQEPGLSGGPLMDFDASEIPPAQNNTALVLDLPGADGVWAAGKLAGQGYRPVPLYNAVPGPSAPISDAIWINRTFALVDVTQILTALWHQTSRLHEMNLLPNSPPAFLLDANRRGEGLTPAPGRFDNRSISFTTDFPSATFLRANDIARVVLIQTGRDDAQPDLAHTLRRWQDGGISIELKRLEVDGPPSPLIVQAPSGFGLLWQRALGMLGFRRSGLGGFGGFVPEPSSG
jgi:hypothetical protein